jgi:hypothetical protein
VKTHKKNRRKSMEITQIKNDGLYKGKFSLEKKGKDKAEEVEREVYHYKNVNKTFIFEKTKKWEKQKKKSPLEETITIGTKKIRMYIIAGLLKVEDVINIDKLEVIDTVIF